MTIYLKSIFITLYVLSPFVVDDGCPYEVDDIWKIEWPSTQRGVTNIQLCPGGQDSTGIYTPLCIFDTTYVH